jgi:transcriptional regulator with XRE-family HTH domain
MNFTVREPVTGSLSTAPSPQAYKPRMSQTLKAYFDAERGRQARLADALEVSRSYLSDVANGNKEGSVDLLRRIAELTGLDMNDLVGRKPGMSEGDATPYQPGPRANRLRDTVGMLFPGLRNVDYYIANADHPAFGILAGDLLVLETSFTPDRIEAGKLVLGRALIDDRASQTVIGRVAQPWLIDGAGRISGQIEIDVGIVGLIQVVLRSADPSAF